MCGFKPSIRKALKKSFKTLLFIITAGKRKCFVCDHKSIYLCYFCELFRWHLLTGFKKHHLWMAQFSSFPKNGESAWMIHSH